MTRLWNACLLALFCFGIFLGSAFAETIELVTYYPTSSSTGDLHAKSLTVGAAYNGVTPTDGVAAISNLLYVGGGYDPANPPAAGTLFQVKGVDNTSNNVLFLPGAGAGADIRVGIGTNNPQGPLHVVGVDNAASNVLFMPGGGTGTIGVGIGINPPPSLLGVGGNSSAAGTRQAITIGNAGFGVPTAEGTPSNGDKLVLWNDAATTYKAGIGLNAANELWLQSSGNNANNKITFYTSNASTAPSQKMMIDSNGNVGIGTTSPQRKLDVAGDLQVGGATPSGTGMNVGSVNFRNTTTGTWWHWTLRGPDQGSNLEMHVRPSGTGVPNIPLAMTPAGNVGIGTNTPITKLDVNGAAAFQGNSIYVKNPVSPANTKSWGFVVQSDGSGFVMGRSNDTIGAGGLNQDHIVMAPNGTTFVYGFVSASDSRLKTEIVPLTGALEKIASLEGVQFHWKDHPDERRYHMGFIAQDVEKVFPDLVYTGPDGMKSIASVEMIGVLTEAIKELKAENERLRADDDELKRKLALIEARLAKDNPK